jgi:hypothetical protein
VYAYVLLHGDPEMVVIYTWFEINVAKGRYICPFFVSRVGLGGEHLFRQDILAQFVECL